MGSDDVVLYGTWSSFFVDRVKWALKMKGVEYQYVEEDLLNKSPMLLQYNPVYKKVPVFVHAGNPIAESTVILQYIDEVWPQNPIMPEDPYDRAMARFWAKFIDEKCKEAVWAAISPFTDEPGKNIEPALAALEVLDDHLRGRKFFSGDTIGYTDLVAGWIPRWMAAMEEFAGTKLLDPQRFPSLHAWACKFLEVPIIRDSQAPHDKLVERIKEYRKLHLAKLK
ncbi:glutathione transferase GST 23-like [Nymphaea colorata]|nr:glutathione transferase GST 23-like [Nymphaea colorata]